MLDNGASSCATGGRSPRVDALMEQAQGGYVTLDDIARLPVFLASERSRFCTGAAYVVDGGLTASMM